LWILGDELCSRNLTFDPLAEAAGEQRRCQLRLLLLCALELQNSLHIDHSRGHAHQQNAGGDKH